MSNLEDGKISTPSVPTPPNSGGSATDEAQGDISLSEKVRLEPGRAGLSRNPKVSNEGGMNFRAAKGMVEPKPLIPMHLDTDGVVTGGHKEIGLRRTAGNKKDLQGISRSDQDMDVESNPDQQIEVEVEEQEEESAIKGRINKVAKVANVASVAAHFLGQEGISEALHLGSAAAGGVSGEDKEAQKGHWGNIAGSQAAKFAQGKGLARKAYGKTGLKEPGKISKGKASALGGALAGAMQGEGAVGIAESALSWYILDFAFSSLLTPWSPVALIYLDIHYVLSKFNFLWFKSLTTIQSLTLLLANLIYLIGIALIVMIFILVGCSYPGPGKFSVMSLLGYGSICESISGSAASSFSFGGGDSGGGGASDKWGGAGSGTCSPAKTQYASPEYLSTTCFGQNAVLASSIAFAESGGDPLRPSGVDKCEPGGEAVSWGLFQINLTNHKIAGLNCPAAFSAQYTGRNHQCTIIDPLLYAQCVAAAKNPINNIQEACRISTNGTHWGQWGANRICGFTP